MVLEGDKHILEQTVPPIRVLIVDDSVEFLETVERFLATDQQIEVVGRALSGPEAIEQVEQLHPDLVLMDLAMPGMNGLEATRRINVQPNAPPVLILTLHDNVEYRAAAEELEVAGYVVKSEFFDQLLPAIHAQFARRHAPVGQENESHPEEADMKNILVVDDSPTMRRMVIAALRGRPGIAFDEAASGLEAIERLALAPVHLMILDLNMPDIHGFEVLEFVSRHPAYHKVPIIVLTTRGDEESRTIALESGAALYLTKPFDPDAFAGQVCELLEAG